MKELTGQIFPPSSALELHFVYMTVVNIKKKKKG